MQKSTIIIPDEDIRIIDHCRKYLLFNVNKPWKKRETERCFDVTIGSCDGAEIRELVGIYILTLLAKIVKKSDCQFYKDDSLLILHNINRQQIERTHKNINKAFNKVEFSINIEINSKVTDFFITIQSK